MMIGFTGTPIIMGDKKRTHDIFGEHIDRYTIKEAERDGATVPILRWYSNRAGDWLSTRVKEHARRMGVEPTGVKVQDLGYRRGSCDKGNPGLLPLEDHPAAAPYRRVRGHARAGPPP